MKKTIKQRVVDFIGEENLEFVRHTRNYLSGTVITSVLTAAFLPVLTHFLSPEDFGSWSIFAATVRLFIILFGLNISSGLVRYYLEKRSDYGEALSSNLILILLFMPLPILTIYLLRHEILAFLQWDSLMLVLAVSLGIVSVWAEMFLAYLNASKQSSKYALLTSMRTLGILSISVGLMIWMEDKRYLGRIYGELIAFVLFSAFAFASLCKLASFSFKSKYMKYSLRFALPLIPHIMSRYIMGYIDRFMILQLTTGVATGLYSFAYDVGMAMNMIVLSTVRAWRPIFFDEYREENYAKLNRMVREYANNVYIVAAAIILFAKDAVLLLANEKYHSSSHIIPAVVMAYVFVFLYTLYFQYASFKKRTELISLSSFIAGFSNIGLNYWLIPIYGYAAAAYTTFASYGILFFLHFCNAKFILKAKTIPLRRVMPNFLLLCGFASLAIYLDQQIESYWLLLGIRFVMLAVALTYYVKTKNSKQTN